MIKMGSIRFTNTNKSVKDLSSYVLRGDISFALPIQRGYVWDKSKKSAFILNMIEGGPTFPIYVNQVDGIDYVIDGQQRLRTTSGFIENKFSLLNPSIVELPTGEKEDISGKKFKDLPQKIKDAIIRYTFDYNFGEDLTEEQVRQIFIRLNNGKPLSAAEMTKAQIQSIHEVKEIAKHSVFKKIVSTNGFESSKNDDLVMQIYIVLFEDKTDLLAVPIRKILSKKAIAQEEQDVIIKCLNCFEEIYLKLNSDNSYEAKRAGIFLKKKSHFISFISVINKCILNNLYDESLLADWIKYFFNGQIDKTSICEEYNALLLGGTNKRVSVNSRMNLMYDNFLNYKLERV